MMRNSTTENRDGAERGGVQAIARAAAVLRALERAPEGISLSQLAATTELPKSTTHRIVAALAAEQLVAHERGGSVRLGAAAARLGAASREALGERLRPVLLRLRRQLDETVDLAVLDGACVRFVDQVPAPRRLRATSSVGELFPLHCTANGKALLAALPEARVLELLPTHLPRLTAHTVTSREQLIAELATVREQGVAFDREEHTEGICAVGAAISDGEDAATAAISVPVPSQRFGAEEGAITKATRAASAAATELLSAG
jgi:DNA-binding IclR family transcriptional regulator